MTVIFDIPEGVESKFAADAQLRGILPADYVRELVLEHYNGEDKDLCVAQERLADAQPGITSNQLCKRLGLDD